MHRITHRNDMKPKKEWPVYTYVDADTYAFLKQFQEMLNAKNANYITFSEAMRQLLAAGKAALWPTWPE